MRGFDRWELLADVGAAVLVAGAVALYGGWERTGLVLVLVGTVGSFVSLGLE